MRLQCPNCSARYRVPDGAIPATGRSVQCSACGASWTQPGLLPLDDPEPASLAEPSPALRERPSEDGGWSVLGPEGSPADTLRPVDLTCSGTARDDSPRKAAQDTPAAPEPEAEDPLDRAINAARAAERGRAFHRMPAEPDTEPDVQDVGGEPEAGPDPAAGDTVPPEQDTALPPMPEASRRAHAREDALIRSLQSRLSERERRAEATAVAAISTLLSRQGAGPQEGSEPLRPMPAPERAAPARSLPVHLPAPVPPDRAERAPASPGRFALGLALPLVVFGAALLLYVLQDTVSGLLPDAAPALDGYVDGIDTARSVLREGWQSALASVKDLAGR
ncbi:hypothetical protein FDP22_10450 [Paroceanicella profunda]|uniref:Zinc finger/thioredoxin putative domain-containing protein n=1 Tax=Paroceanicella profunda TaxID=2579971 RepID=A0A5B8FTP8_9RHOB|nr:zinc-ribbon domain-containing protein [Paroceanicella profunda]QDL92156.1 hypothetical protein FDP22_10450 [Paroceanicella profunda]